MTGSGNAGLRQPTNRGRRTAQKRHIVRLSDAINESPVTRYNQNLVHSLLFWSERAVGSRV
jgi:hypothetical protein